MLVLNKFLFPISTLGGHLFGTNRSASTCLRTPLPISPGCWTTLASRKQACIFFLNCSMVKVTGNTFLAHTFLIGQLQSLMRRFIFAFSTVCWTNLNSFVQARVLSDTVVPKYYWWPEQVCEGCWLVRLLSHAPKNTIEWLVHSLYPTSVGRQQKGKILSNYKNIQKWISA